MTTSAARSPLACTCSPALIARLVTLSEAALAATYGQMVTVLRKLRGAHVAWEPMYPNFPQQVMEAPAAPGPASSLSIAMVAALPATTHRSATTVTDARRRVGHPVRGFRMWP